MVYTLQNDHKIHERLEELRTQLNELLASEDYDKEDALQLSQEFDCLLNIYLKEYT